MNRDIEGLELPQPNGVCAINQTLYVQGHGIVFRAFGAPGSTEDAYWETLREHGYLVCEHATPSVWVFWGIYLDSQGVKVYNVTTMDIHQACELMEFPDRIREHAETMSNGHQVPLTPDIFLACAEFTQFLGQNGIYGDQTDNPIDFGALGDTDWLDSLESFFENGDDNDH